MSALLQERYSLPVITCSLALDPRGIDKRSGESGVRFQLHLGAEPLHDVTVPSSEMKLPPSLRRIARNAGVRKLHMPQRVIDEFRRALADRPADEPLWLRLESPSGHLGAVPWEHLFQPRLRKPIFRLPEVVLPAVPTGRRLEVVVNACCPRTTAPYDVRRLLHEFVAEIRDIDLDGTGITVFTALEGAESELADLEVRVRRVDGELPPEEQDVPEVTSPWLRRVAHEMSDTSVDVVHFICPGHLDASSGALWLGAADATHGPAPVQAGEVCAFMTHVGAWAAGFTIPSLRAWPAGIRVLAHRLAKDLTGPLVVDAPHHRKGGGPGVGAAYRLLFGSAPVEAPRSPGMTIYVHPQRVHEVVPSAGVVESALAFERDWIGFAQGLTLAGAASEETLTVPGEPPRELAAKQRALEQLASELLIPPGDSRYAQAANQGLADALAFMKDLLATEARTQEDDPQ
jgi:hypothetical protein